nr:MAG TPA: hypothetical protein [Bacteriophage sp.]
MILFSESARFTVSFGMYCRWIFWIFSDFVY